MREEKNENRFPENLLEIRLLILPHELKSTTALSPITTTRVGQDNHKNHSNKIR